MSTFKYKNKFLIDVRKTVTSTNMELRDLAAKGAPEGYVLIAEEQTAGKGRQGRSFHSPAGHGAYFSLLLRPGHGMEDVSQITPAAAVAAARAIEDIFGVRVGIKWVNDLFISGKKVCGILTEAVFSAESGHIESAVLGIGINITKPEEGFPKDIESVAAALTDRRFIEDEERCRLVMATLDNFWGFYENLPARAFLAEYRARSILLGQDIFVLSDGGKRAARALEIDDDCGLLVQYETGETATLRSGEVSVRMLN